MLSLAILALAIIGCGGGADITPGAEVDVNGTVTVAGGKLPVGVSIAFQPTGGTARPASFPLNADGTFSGKMIVGKYSYYLSIPEGNAKLEAALKSVPESARKASLERQIDVKGGALQLSF
jgi:hypothetical protein